MLNSFNNLKITSLERTISSICQYDYMYFLSKSNVVGVALGYKVKNNIRTNELCITVFVDKKISKSTLCCNNLIPKQYKGIPTDVIESGQFYELSLTDRIRPVEGGYSISNEGSISAGTMSCIVKDENDDYYILSNNHVIALSNSAPIGSRIVQPGRLDGGVVATDTIATLSKFIELEYETPQALPENYVDCAIAKVLDKSLVTPIIAQIGLPNEPIDPKLGMSVKKVGKSTELSIGTILHTNATIKFPTKKGVLLYKDQIIANEPNSNGDSGALLVDMNNNALGLLVMGSNNGLVSHCSMDTVLISLDVELVTN